MDKESIIKEIRGYKRRIPKPQSNDESWLKYLQKLNYFIQDVQGVTGRFDAILANLWNNFQDDKRYRGGVPIMYDGTVEYYFKIGENLRQFFGVMEEWIKHGFEQGRFPVQQQKQTIQVKGWWFIANGKQVVLQVRGTNIDLSARVRGTGKGIPIIVCNLLSHLNTEEIAKSAVEDVLEKRGEDYTGRTVADAVRNLNSLVREEVKIDFDFLLPTDSGYSVNPKVWE